MYVQLLVVAILSVITAIYFDPALRAFFHFDSAPQKPRNRLFTSEELSLYNGESKPELYLAILGKVFDVSKSWNHYGPGQSYHFFTGRDGSRSFVTGKFDETEASDQVADLVPEELRSLNHWVRFYGKEYQRIGKLIGRYYREDGKLTQYGREVKKLMKTADEAQQDKDREKLKYPPCNIEFDPSKGSRVWCTNKSGGIERDWIGVPRQLYEPGSHNYRCACINLDRDSEMANLKQYEGCDSRSVTCLIKL
ncbi:neuferricin [Asbolus verrucosus]|uniref:Neuferricin n=1 Tax=Asbolus verrucosus TaxID=1661398 RepID=A0A482VJ88_ASBVE|nr:neuferricin [Asbolus verrucosus]